MEGKDAKCISRGIKQIIVIDMANIDIRMQQTSEKANKQDSK